MKHYQDTDTGQVYAFEDEVDPFALALTNRNIPKTLSENVIPKPSEAHVWFNGGWIKNSDAPKNYEQPTSSIPTYNPAWVVFLQPYTAVLVTPRDKLEVTLEQINSNSYDNDKLSKVVMSLPLSETGLQAFVTYDGAVSIPRNDQFPTNELAITGFNRILCAILLGGMHVEVVSPSELYSGTLLNGTDIFLHNPTIQGNLRHKLTPITDRMLPLMHPRIISAQDLINAHRHGVSVMNCIKNFSPHFLLHGYTSMIKQNRSDALGSLWIVVEQLTWAIWESKFIQSPQFHPACEMKSRKDSLKSDNRTWPISVKHELLWQTKLLSDQCYEALSVARKLRNDLVHRGDAPDFIAISNLWKNLSEMFETASGINLDGMRRLLPLGSPSLGLPHKGNFDEWKKLEGKVFKGA